MKNDILEILQQHKLGHIPDEQALKELFVLFSVVKSFYCKTKRCDKTKQCDECALQELNDMQ